ncbi:hypothetical protein FF36_04380 [Frankia torreyi]|uniref:Uncharacterized protein n=1 Tax=Frankia torreyi TaxID=1856 RepID=A0A0D8BB71_9ACTN|nr:hypothetical protein FF36_04380 [Frankia torreyi]KQC35566.1 hypothetical protein UK82_25645 [Frankia sp. ACN1ag]KQM03398.1 hypothetical protein FF86_104142 [Frankia sp. CpI1-P]
MAAAPLSHPAAARVRVAGRIAPRGPAVARIVPVCRLADRGRRARSGRPVAAVIVLPGGVVLLLASDRLPVGSTHPMVPSFVTALARARSLSGRTKRGFALHPMLPTGAASTGCQSVDRPEFRAVATAAGSPVGRAVPAVVGREPGAARLGAPLR